MSTIQVISAMFIISFYATFKCEFIPFSAALDIRLSLFSDCQDEKEWCNDVKILNCEVVVSTEHPNILVRDVCKRKCNICNNINNQTVV